MPVWDFIVLILLLLVAFLVLKPRAEQIGALVMRLLGIPEPPVYSKEEGKENGCGNEAGNEH